MGERVVIIGDILILLSTLILILARYHTARYHTANQKRRKLLPVHKHLQPAVLYVKIILKVDVRKFWFLDLNL